MQTKDLKIQDRYKNYEGPTSGWNIKTLNVHFIFKKGSILATWLLVINISYLLAVTPEILLPTASQNVKNI